MRVLLLIAIVVVAAPVRENPAPKEKSLQEQILGEWESVQIVDGGEEVKELKLKLVFTAKEVHLYENGERKADDDAIYTIDANKTPATFDLNPLKKGEKKERGIFKIEGDQMTVAVLEEGDGPRPSEFRSPAESKIVLIQFKRVKK